MKIDVEKRPPAEYKGKLKGKVLSVNVASAGAVKVTGRLLKPSQASGGPGTVKVRLKLTAAAKQALKSKGFVKLRASVTFTPTGGTANSKTARLKVKK